MKRIAPALTLFFLGPFVAEFLLGNLPLTVLPAMIVLAPMYGGGALLIRESVRRTGRGWPTILVLGLAYAVLEEAFTTQTLFNPNYLKLNLHLLDHAYIPWLGMGAWWTIFVLTLHVVWSIGVSIALAEGLVPDRETSPWLARRGLIVTALLFVLGIAITTAMTLHGDRYVAPISKLVSAAVVVAALVALAFWIPTRRVDAMSGDVPSPWVAGALALVAGSAFLVVPPTWNWWAVLSYLVLFIVTTALVWRWSSDRTRWTAMHRFALAGGAALAYAWHAFPEPPVVPAPPAVDLAGNAICALVLLAILTTAARRITRQNANRTST